MEAMTTVCGDHGASLALEADGSEFAGEGTRRVASGARSGCDDYEEAGNSGGSEGSGGSSDPFSAVDGGPGGRDIKARITRGSGVGGTAGSNANNRDPAPFDG